MKKLKLNRESIRHLASATLSRVGGGAAPAPTAGVLCGNTVQVCIDTDGPTACPCQEPSFRCGPATVGCPVFSAGC